MIRYVDAHKDERDKIEDYIDLLHRHLCHYISKEELREDVIFCFDNGRALGAYKDDEIIGAVVGVYTPFFKKFHVAHLAVEPTFRRKDLGNELMERVVPEDMSPSVHLNMENPDTRRFYENIGYVKTHVRFQKRER